MFCSGCGYSLSVDSLYCPRCGAPLKPPIPAPPIPFVPPYSIGLPQPLRYRPVPSVGAAILLAIPLVLSLINLSSTFTFLFQDFFPIDHYTIVSLIRQILSVAIVFLCILLFAGALRGQAVNIPVIMIFISATAALWLFIDSLFAFFSLIAVIREAPPHYVVLTYGGSFLSIVICVCNGLALLRAQTNPSVAIRYAVGFWLCMFFQIVFSILLSYVTAGSDAGALYHLFENSFRQIPGYLSSLVFHPLALLLHIDRQRQIPLYPQAQTPFQ